MDTMESTELLTSPFSGAAPAVGDEGSPADETFEGYHRPAASPFSQGLSTDDEQQAVETRWLGLVDELADESFDKAVDDIVAEAAGRYLRARSRSPLDADATQAGAEVETWLAGRAEATDRALAGLEREYADRVAPLGEGDTSINEGMDQFLGGLVKKAFKAAGSLARAGLSGLAKILPLGRIFGLLRRLVRPLLKRVLDKALGRLPAPLQGPARVLAGKLGLGEDETTDAFALGESFDQELAQLLLAPTDAGAGELLAELEAEAAAPAPDPLSRLDRARATLTEQLATAEASRPPTEQLEQFIPAVMAAMPLIRAGLKIVGRGKVVRFLAGHLATLIQPHIGPDAARALAPRIADTGLRLLSLEAEAPPLLGAEALVDTLEETVRTVLELPAASLEDPLRLEAETDTALAEAAARLLPASALRPDLDTFESSDREAQWILMPRRTPRCRRYRTYGRVFDVAITRPQARAVVLTGEDTLEERLEEAGVERWPVTGEVQLYESILGTQPGHLTALEDESAAVGADEFEELTPEVATVLVGRPGLGRRYPLGSRPMAPGRRFFRLVVPGRVVRRRRPRLLVRVDAAATPLTVRLHLRLGERSSDVLSGHLTRRAFPDALAAVTRLVGPRVRRHLSERLVVRLRRALGAGVTPARAEALGAQLVEGLLRALSAQLPGSAPALLAAIKDPAPGITLTFVFPFADKAALETGRPGEPTMTIRPGRHHD
jgi:hypothetical protein